MVSTKKTSSFGGIKKQVLVFYRLHNQFVIIAGALIVLGVGLLLMQDGFSAWLGKRFFPQSAQQTVSQDLIRTNKQLQVADIVNKGEIAACDTVPDPGTGVDYKSVCRNNIYLKAAFATLDFATCDKLTAGYSSEDCKKEVIEKLIASKANASVCAALSSELKLFCQDRFTAATAVYAKTIASCDAIINVLIKNDCQEKVLLNTLRADGKKTNCLVFVGDIKAQCVTVVSALNGPKSDVHKRQLQCAAVPNEDIAGYCEQEVLGLLQ